MRGGGHGFPGFGTNDGGVVIDLSKLANVDIIDKERHLVRIGGGPEAPLEIYAAFDGDDPELAARAIDPIRRLGTVIDDDVALQPYGDTLADGRPPPTGLQFAIRSAFVDTESVPEVLRILAEVRASERSPFIAVRSVGGAVYPTQVHNRLAAVKRRYDPGNLFSRNHNVRPT